MEILTYVLGGALAHKDSMGNVETLQKQRFAAHQRRQRDRAQRVQRVPQRAGTFPADLAGTGSQRT